MLPPEQRIYAHWLDRGTRLGLFLLVASFLAYVLELVDPIVPLNRLPSLWGLPAERYLAATGAPTGWGWLSRLAAGEYLSLGAIALLSLVTVACYLRIVPIHARRGEKLHAAIALAQIVVLLAAAGGVFGGGH